MTSIIMRETGNNLKHRHLHLLGELRCLIVDVNHSNPYCSCASARDIPFVNGHHHKLIEMVRPLIVQRPCGEDGPVRGNGEVLTQGVIGQLCILL